MFHQLLTPVGDNLALSFVVAAAPIAVVLVMLGVLRRPAWAASLGGLIVALAIAVLVWRFPVRLAINSIAAGVVFALWPVMWIVFNALLLYNIAVASGRFDAFRDWVLNHLPNDRRIVLVVIGFCFGCLLEGISGFGTPVAITSALLILVGFPALEALTFTLIFNTAPVAFGALGVPITVLGQVTGLSPVTLGAMVGYLLPFIAMLLPFYVMTIYGGTRSLRALWPVLAVAGGSFALGQFVSSNFLDYALTDVLSSLTALISTLAFLRVGSLRPTLSFVSLCGRFRRAAPIRPEGAWECDVPLAGMAALLVVSAVVILGPTSRCLQSASRRPRPGLHNEIAITLYKDKPHAVNWVFQPLATGTAILLSTIITSALVGVGPRLVHQNASSATLGGRV